MRFGNRFRHTYWCASTQRQDAARPRTPAVDGGAGLLVRGEGDEGEVLVRGHVRAGYHACSSVCCWVCRRWSVEHIYMWGRIRSFQPSHTSKPQSVHIPPSQPHNAP